MARQTRTGFEGSPEFGGRDRDRRRDVQGPENNPDAGRPRTEYGGGLLDGGDERDTTREESGLVERAGAFLDDLHQDLQQSLAGPPSVNRPPPTERFGAGIRPPSDEVSLGAIRPVRPPEDEEPVIFPGDPDDLGARGRRRRTREDGNASPVLRRGLLGV